MRTVITEHKSPLFVSPDLLKLDWVTNESGIKESQLMESLIKPFELKVNESKDEQFIEAWKSERAKFIQEMLGKSRRLTVSGPAQMEDKKNGNGRIYPKTLWDAILREDGDFITRLKNGFILGELEHPDCGNTKLPRVSHKLLEVWRDKGVIYNKVLIFRTPMGAIAEELFTNGVPVGQSSRGSGNIKTTEQGDIVENDFLLDTWDLVYQPSVSVARLTPFEESQSDKKTESKPSTLYYVIKSNPVTENGSPHMSSPVATPNVAMLKESSDRLASAKLLQTNVSGYLKGPVTLSEIGRASCRERVCLYV